MTLRDVSNSELRAFKRCRRRWWLSHFLALRLRRPEVVGAAPIGDRMHKVLGDYYSPDNEVVVDAASALARWDELVTADLARLGQYTYAAAAAAGMDELTAAGFVQREQTELRKESDLGRAMIEGYFEYLAESGVDSDLRIIASERIARVEMGGDLPVALVSKQDVKVERRSDRARLFLDHKTVDNFTVPGKVAHLDEQFLFYGLVDFLEYLRDGEGAFVDGGIFNFLRKVKRTRQAKPPFFSRLDVRHNVDELRSFWYRVAGEVEDLLRVEAQLRDGGDHRRIAYANPTRDCAWDCAFFTLCPMLDDPSSDARAFIDDHYEAVDPYLRYREPVAADEVG